MTISRTSLVVIISIVFFITCIGIGFGEETSCYREAYHVPSKYPILQGKVLSGLNQWRQVNQNSYFGAFSVQATAIYLPPGSPGGPAIKVGDTVRVFLTISSPDPPIVSVGGCCELVGPISTVDGIVLQCNQVDDDYTRYSAYMNCNYPYPPPKGWIPWGGTVDPCKSDPDPGPDPGPGPDPDPPVPTSLPDLVIPSLTGPTCANPGQSITIIDTIKNIGNAPVTSGFVIRYGLSTDSKPDVNDIELGSRSIASMGSSGSSNSRSVALTIPSNTPAGTYYLFAQVDSTYAIQESNEGNNWYTSLRIQIPCNQLPDLVVNSLSGPTCANPGQSLTISHIVKNAGNGAASPFNIDYYLSADGDLSNIGFGMSDWYLGQRSISSLAAGSTNSQSFTVTVPSNIPSGSYYLMAVADPGSIIVESNEGNNNYVGPKITIPCSQPSGEVYINIIRVTYSDPNDGSGTTVVEKDGELGSFRVRKGVKIKISATGVNEFTDQSAASWDAILGIYENGNPVSSEINVPSNSGESRAVMYEYTATETRTFDVRIKVNKRPEIYDVKRITIEVFSSAQPDLIIASLNGSACADPGKSITVTNTVKNQGSEASSAFKVAYYLSSDNSFSPISDYYLGEKSVSSLAAGETNSQSFTCSVPSNVPSGSYYIIASADTSNIVLEKEEGNNWLASSSKIQIPCSEATKPDLIITNIKGPNCVNSGQSITVTSTVKNVGNGPASAFSVSYYLSRSDRDILLGSSSINSLAGSGSITSQSSSFNVPLSIPSGSYNLIGVVDSSRIILESNEENNVNKDTKIQIPCSESCIKLVQTAYEDRPKTKCSWFMCLNDVAIDVTYNVSSGKPPLPVKITIQNKKATSYNVEIRKLPENTLVGCTKCPSDVYDCINCRFLGPKDKLTYETVFRGVPGEELEIYVTRDSDAARYANIVDVVIYGLTSLAGHGIHATSSSAVNDWLAKALGVEILTCFGNGDWWCVISGIIGYFTDPSYGIYRIDEFGKLLIQEGLWPSYLDWDPWAIQRNLKEATAIMQWLDALSILFDVTEESSPLYDWVDIWSEPSTSCTSYDVVPTTFTIPAPSGTGTGSLTVTSSPSQATVYVDGVYRGTTPLTLTGLSTGIHQIRVTKTGYQDYSMAVSVPKGKTTTLAAKMVTGSSSTVPTTVPTTVPLTTQTQIPPGTGTGSLTVTSTPSQATVYIDGVYRGTTPLTLTGVSTGIHQIRVTKTGYQDYSMTVSVPKGKTTTLAAKMVTGSSSTVPTTVPTTVPLTTQTQIPSGTGTGSLTVTSTPSQATVYVDGVYRGTTPLTLTGLSTGIHQIRVTKTGYQDYSMAVSVPKGKTATLTAKMVTGSSTTIPTTVPTTFPLTTQTQNPSGTGTGSLTVTSTPSQATVYVDGVYRGTTPLTLTGVSIGIHQIRVTKSGYQDYSMSISVFKGKTATLTAKMVIGSSTTIPTTVPTTIPLTTQTQIPSGTSTGSLTVTSTPSQATVYVDGVYRGTTPLTLTGVSTGIHQIKVTKSGYQDYSMSVSVPKGKTATIPVALKVVSSNEPAKIPTTLPTSVRYTFTTAWGTKGSGDGQFFSPSDIAIDNQGNVLVVDRFNYRIQKFDSSGNFLTKWGSKGNGNGQFGENGLNELAIDPSGTVYVVDNRKECIQKFDSSGRYLMQWGSEGNDDARLHFIYDIAVSSAGTIYIADWGGDAIAAIKMYDSSGKFIGKLGSRGPNPSQFYYPYSIAIDSSRNVYVSDCAKHQIQKYDSSGNYIMRWDSAGSGSTCMASILATDQAGNVFESDPSGNRIRIFSPTGKLVTSWGSLGSGNGQFNWPWGVAIDKSGDVYVVDQGNNRIQKFKISS